VDAEEYQGPAPCSASSAHDLERKDESSSDSSGSEELSDDESTENEEDDDDDEESAVNGECVAEESEDDDAEEAAAEKEDTDPFRCFLCSSALTETEEKDGDDGSDDLEATARVSGSASPGAVLPMLREFTCSQSQRSSLTSDGVSYSSSESDDGEEETGEEERGEIDPEARSGECISTAGERL